jgi:solute carrier family 41
LGGLVLDSAVDQFTGFVVFQPIINGIGGNLVSVQASRISTMLHKTSLKGVIPPHTKQWVWPWKALIRGVLPAKSARILLLMMIPGQTVFVFVADLIYNEGVSCVYPAFALTYVGVSLLQIMLLLYIAHIMIHTMWRFKMDPDNSAIPYLTALGDLLGSSLLLLAFIFLRAIHQDYTPVILEETANN